MFKTLKRIELLKEALYIKTQANVDSQQILNSSQKQIEEHTSMHPRGTH